MSVAMDRALMALSLEDEEEDEHPFTMPELPGFSSVEENALSIMGDFSTRNAKRCLV